MFLGSVRQIPQLVPLALPGLPSGSSAAWDEQYKCATVLLLKFSTQPGINTGFFAEGFGGMLHQENFTTSETVSGGF